MKRFAIFLMTISSGIWLAATAALPAPIPENCQTGDFAIGCQAWTFHDFTVMEAIEKTAAAGGKVLGLYPGQKFSTDKPDLKFDHNVTDEMIALVKAQLKKFNVCAVNYGVVGIPKDEAEARNIFEFAKNFELYGITTESVDAIDTIEKLVKKYDIHVGFHDHPRQLNNPDYKMWGPNYILSVVKDRDVRIGSCADVGHWGRSGLDPVACLKILEGRIISSHLQDLNEKSPDVHDVPFGTGGSNIAGILNELKRQHFNGNVSIEYEYNWSNNVIDAAQCIDFVRGYGQK
jgi:sugar phosphate isomerase/epimerase